LELELKAGCIGPIYRLAAELQALAPLWISPESKSSRGWHLRNGQTEGAQKRSIPILRPSTQAADGLREIIDVTLGHLMANITPTLHGDVEGVHQMRMALCGTRAALNLFEEYLEVAATANFNGRLRRFAQIFGKARDWDVFCLETLPTAAADLPVARIRDLNAVAEVQRQSAHVAVADCVRGQDFTSLVLGLAAWVEFGAMKPTSIGSEQLRSRLGNLAPSLLDRVAAKAKSRGRHLGRLSVVELHSLRKSLKKLCCDVVYLAGLFRGRSVNAYVGRCEDVLEMLGVANDATVTQRLAPTLVTDRRPDLAKPAEALSKWSKRRGRKAMRGLKSSLKEFRQAPAFWSPVVKKHRGAAAAIAKRTGKHGWTGAVADTLF
jgi:CHAD domain-containing protein